MRTCAIRVIVVALVVACGAFMGGCLIKDTTHTICLEPDGSATWTVLEQRIHAVADTPADRLNEEEEFMAAVRSNNHPVAAAFRTLGAVNVVPTVVFPNWPYAVATEAHVPDIAAAVQRTLDAVTELRGRSVLERHGDRVVWRITVNYDPTRTNPSGEKRPEEDAVTSLLSDNDDQGPIFLIRHGQFVDATGFSISDDGRVARAKDLSEHDWDKEPQLEFSLTWTAVEAVTRK